MATKPKMPESFSKSVDHMADRAFAALDLDPGIASVIKACEAIIEVNFPVPIKGKIEIFTGWRATHRALGHLRVHGQRSHGRRRLRGRRGLGQDVGRGRRVVA